MTTPHKQGPILPGDEDFAFPRYGRPEKGAKPLRRGAPPARTSRPPEKSKKEVSVVLEACTRIFNAAVRARDSAQGWFYCISCGLYKPVAEMHAGHFIPCENWAVRYHPVNVNGQCSTCNCTMEGNLVLYRVGLIAKYGEPAVLALEALAAVPTPKPRLHEARVLVALISVWAMDPRPLELPRGPVVEVT